LRIKDPGTFNSIASQGNKRKDIIKSQKKKSWVYQNEESYGFCQRVFTRNSKDKWKLIKMQ